MNEFEQLYAKPGDSKRRKFNQLVNWLEAKKRAAQLAAGPNIRLARSSAGTAVIADGEGESWAHPWRPSLRGRNELVIAPGTVNDRIPQIDGKALDAMPAPALKLGGPGVMNRSYVVVTARIDREGSLVDDDTALTIRHVTEPPAQRTDSTVIALIVWADARTIRAVHPVAHFDLTLETDRSGQTTRYYFHV